MVDAPVGEEFPCHRGSEFRAPVGRDIFWNAEGYEYGSQVPYKASSPIARTFDNGPVGVAIHNDHISVAFVVEIVCTDALE